jgi:hypothetical protein
MVIGRDDNGDDITIEFEISEACGTTFHTSLDAESPSFIRWVFQAPGLEPGTEVQLTGSDGFIQFTKVLDDRTIVTEQGISSYGDYAFPSVEWKEGSGSTATISPDGNHTVDDREGEPSLTCRS